MALITSGCAACSSTRTRSTRPAPRTAPSWRCAFSHDPAAFPCLPLHFHCLSLTFHCLSLTFHYLFTAFSLPFHRPITALSSPQDTINVAKAKEGKASKISSVSRESEMAEEDDEEEDDEEEDGGPVFIKSVWEADTLNGAFKNMLLGTFLVRCPHSAKLLAPSSPFYLQHQSCESERRCQKGIGSVAAPAQN